MNPKRTVMVTWLAMLGIQTVGSIDAKHRMPAPRQYVAIGALWAIMFLGVETAAAKTFARLSVLVLLTASVIGPFGARAIQVLRNIGSGFAIPPTQQAGSNIPPSIITTPPSAAQRPTVPA